MSKYQDALDNLTLYLPKYYGSATTQQNIKMMNDTSVMVLQELIDKYGKEPKIVDLHCKCGACVYLDYNQRKSKIEYYACTNKDKPEKSYFSHWKHKTEKCCKFYEQRNDIELTYVKGQTNETNNNNSCL